MGKITVQTFNIQRTTYVFFSLYLEDHDYNFNKNLWKIKQNNLKVMNNFM